MSKYQPIKSYNGSLSGENQPVYQGLEYDWEVPDNMIVASPGGTDTTRHHWTKGFYGRGNLSGDIYAGQGDRYISGEYGNLYQSGQTATQDQGYYTAAPDYQYWQNQQPPQYSLGDPQLIPEIGSLPYNGGISMIPDTKPLLKPPPKKTSKGDSNIETYIHANGDFELVEQSDLKKSPQIIENVNNFEEDKSSKVANFLIILVFLFLLFLTFHFWANTIDSSISQKFNKHSYGGTSTKGVDSKTWLFLSMGVTLIFLIAAFFIGNPMKYTY